MNANELAVYLEDITDWEESPYRQAATMLRQQQAEIEALKKEAALQRLSDFTQEAENKPVAIRYDFDGYGYQYMDSGSGSDWQTRVEGEFLYTKSQNMTLSDEEIWAIASEIEPIDLKWGVRLSNELNVLDFARALLRKANEK